MAKINVTTPKGELSWVFITGEGSFNELAEKYEYKATITFPADDPEALALKQKLDDLWENSPEKVKYDKAYEEAKPAVQAKFEQHKGYVFDEDDHGEPLGTISFRFKTNTEFETKKGTKQTVIPVYNALAQKVDIGDTKIGNGTIGRISGTAMSWYKGQAGGVSLYLKSIQIIKLVEYKENEFTAEEGGEFVSATTENEFTGVPVQEDSAEQSPEGV
jgi:hypothetical protein